MQWCLLCQREKANREFQPDRASCRQCLGRSDRWSAQPTYGCPNRGEYGPYIGYARKIADKWWEGNRDEAESIAWEQIVMAKELYDPSRGMPLDQYTKLRTFNEIQNQRRKAEPLNPWTRLRRTIKDDDGEERLMRIEEGIAAQPDGAGPGLRHLVDDPTNQAMVDAYGKVRLWLEWSELFGDPLTFENAKAFFGVTDPTIGNAKAFGHAMKTLGFEARRRRIKGHEGLVRVYEPREPISIAS
jgi:hypothetical protein